MPTPKRPPTPLSTHHRRREEKTCSTKTHKRRGELKTTNAPVPARRPRVPAVPRWQAPLDVLIAELKASAARSFRAADPDKQPSPWTSLVFQQRVAEEVLHSDVAEEFPPRPEYVSRVTKVL